MAFALVPVGTRYMYCNIAILKYNSSKAGAQVAKKKKVAARFLMTVQCDGNIIGLHGPG